MLALVHSIRATWLRSAILLALAASLAGCSSQDFGTPMGGITDVVDSREEYLPSGEAAIAERRAQQIANALLAWQRERGAAEIDYAVGADDLLAVTIYDLEVPGEPTTVRLAVTQEGLLQLPLIGATPVLGMTTRQIEEHVTRLYAGAYLKDPRITVEVAEYRSAPVVVTGAVGKPGIYYLRQNNSTVLEMLSLAQGLTINAGQNLLIVRAGAETNSPPADADSAAVATGTSGPEAAGAADAAAAEEEMLDYDFSQFPDESVAAPAPAEAPVLDAPVLTPTNATPTITVEPSRPPKRRLGLFARSNRNAEDATNAVQATTTDAPTTNVAAADATAPTPKRKARKSKAAKADATAQSPAGEAEGDAAAESTADDGQPHPEMITVDLKRLLDQGDIRLNATVLGGDILTIPARQTRQVYVLGYVQRAGAYEIEAGQETINALKAVALAGGLASAARAQKSVIIRDTGNRRQVVPVDLTKIARGTRPPVFMQAGDTLVVGSTWLAKIGEFIKPSVSAGASVSPAP